MIKLLCFGVVLMILLALMYILHSIVESFTENRIFIASQYGNGNFALGSFAMKSTVSPSPSPTTNQQCSSSVRS